MSPISASTELVIDSGGGLLGTTNKNTPSRTSLCRIPITPAFKDIISATVEDPIRDPLIYIMDIRDFHVDKVTFRGTDATNKINQNRLSAQEVREKDIMK